MNTLVTVHTDNHTLLKPCMRVDFEKHDIHAWIDQLVEVMNEHNGVGIAGPQAGIPYRIAIVKNIDHNNLVLINPSYVQKSGQFTSREGCLSLPEEQYKLKRFSGLVVKNHTSSGSEYNFSTWTKEFSRRIQHEMDHLDGVLIRKKGKKL